MSGEVVFGFVATAATLAGFLGRTWHELRRVDMVVRAARAAGLTVAKDRPVVEAHTTELSRSLSEFDITMIGVGAMIGVGIFVLTASRWEPLGRR